MKVKLEKAASAIALAAIMGSTLVPAYALEVTALPAIPSIIQQQQSGTRIDIVDNELVSDAAYNILNILIDRYKEVLNIGENSSFYLYENGKKVVDGYTVTQYRLEENDKYSLGTLNLIEQNDEFKSIVFIGCEVDKRDNAKLIKTWKSTELGTSKIGNSKRLGIKSLGQYSSGLMQPWCAVTCSAAIVSHFDGVDKEPIQLAKVMLPVVFDNKNNADYWDRSSEQFKTALGADIDMEYRFYNGINSYQLRDFFKQSGYQATYTNSSTSRLYNIGSNINSGSAIVAELSRNGVASHAIVFDEYTDRVLVGFNPSYSKEKDRIVMVYGNSMIPDGISNTIIYTEDKTPKCYSLTGYVSIKLPTGRSADQLFKTKEEYNKLIGDVNNIKNSILHVDSYDTKEAKIISEYADEVKAEEEKAYKEYIETKQRIESKDYNETTHEEKMWLVNTIKYTVQKEENVVYPEEEISPTMAEFAKHLTEKDLREITEAVLGLEPGQGGMIPKDSIEEEAKHYAKDKAIERVAERYNINKSDIIDNNIKESIDNSSETMVDWAKDDAILNEVLADILNIDTNQVGLFVEGIPSESQYGRIILQIPEIAVYAYMCTLSEYTVDKDIIKEINESSTSDIRRAKTYVDDVSEVFGELNIGYKLGELAPASWLSTMLNIRLHETSSIGAIYKYSTMKDFIDQNKAIIMMFRNMDTNERYSVICVDANKIDSNTVRYIVLDPFDANAGEIKKKFITCNTNGTDCYYNNNLIPTNMKWVGSVVTTGTITGDVYNLDYNNYGKLIGGGV